jgi:uncharacterized repeat protein (TIGR03803 family)
MGWVVVLAIFAAMLAGTSGRAAAQTEYLTLHSFIFSSNCGDACPDGYFPVAGLIFDAAGNLYGTTEFGGTEICFDSIYNSGCGVVFELSPRAGGGWSERVLHTFRNDGTDGYFPLASLIFDASGNLYGTAQRGGIRDGGVIFELSPDAGGGWTEKLLYRFPGGDRNGRAPSASLIFDAAGNLYGTTLYGGGTQCATTEVVGCGTVFELSPRAGGGWDGKLLHAFNNNGTDGIYPQTGVITDTAGNLYGTTNMGGPYDLGTVFELSPQADGSWTETILHGFTGGDDGSEPAGGLIFDASGNLYGTTQSYGAGTVFELTPTAGAGWTKTVLHSFNGTNGASPAASLIFDAAGNLYGTTTGGGRGHNGCPFTGGGCGTVFKLSPRAGGGWTEAVLHSFASDGGSSGSLIFDAAGNLYGTTSDGGVNRLIATVRFSKSSPSCDA